MTTMSSKVPTGQSLTEGQSLTVGIDIGGTNMRAGVVSPQGEILDSRQRPTESTTEALDKGIVELVEQLQREYPVEAVGIAVAGFLDPECETVRFAPHLPWRDRPARAILAEKLGLPVRLEHDANAAAWGEYQFGAAQGEDNWVLFAIGTGIGATVMTGGEIYRGAFGTAPEFGHLTVVRDGRECACGKRGCLERYCSGTALETSAREILAASERPSSLRGVSRLSGKTVMEHARAGDPLALEVFAEFSSWLGQALSIVADVLDPGLILIGGGLSDAQDLYFEPARKAMAQQIVGAGYRPLPDVSVAKLGGDAGMIGVSDLARGLL
ncbi:ROK family protein [Corynebacterium kozikiae]|uniref:ROK family protein n=1 Tax=Corynebacterium kozikiae TaxID=2968469 RepID=UPI00359C95EE